MKKKLISVVVLLAAMMLVFSQAKKDIDVNSGAFDEGMPLFDVNENQIPIINT